MNLGSVASACGVSRMTVSRALRNHSEISASTRYRILETAQRMGYKPNALVSAWMSHVVSSKRPTASTVVLYCESYSPVHSYNTMVTRRNYLAGAARRAPEHGLEVQEIWINEPGMHPSRIEQILLTRNVPGLLFGPFENPSTAFSMNLDSFAAVGLSYSMVAPEMTRVCYNHFETLWTAMTELGHLGFRKCALAMTEDHDLRTGRLTSSAFSRCAATSGLGSDLGLFLRPKLEPRELLKWLRSHKPDLLFSHDNGVAEMVQKLPASTRPKFVHLDADYCETPLAFAAIDQNSAAIGAAAVDYLADMIKRNERGLPAYPQTVLIKGRLKLLVPGNLISAKSSNQYDMTTRVGGESLRYR